MANIRIYETPEGAAPEQRIPEEGGLQWMRAARVIGELGREGTAAIKQGIDQLGQGIGKAFKNQEEQQSAQEVAKSTGDLYETQLDLLRQWDDIRLHTPPDQLPAAAARFRQTADEAFERGAQGLQTQRGQLWWQTHSAKARYELEHSVLADTFKAQGVVAFDGLKRGLNAVVAKAGEGTTDLGHSVEQIGTMTDHFKAVTPTANPKVGPELDTIKFQSQQAAVLNRIQTTMLTDPAHARSILNDPRWAEYIGSHRAALEKDIDAADRELQKQAQEQLKISDSVEKDAFRLEQHKAYTARLDPSTPSGFSPDPQAFQTSVHLANLPGARFYPQAAVNYRRFNSSIVKENAAPGSVVTSDQAYIGIQRTLGTYDPNVAGTPGHMGADDLSATYQGMVGDGALTGKDYHFASSRAALIDGNPTMLANQHAFWQFAQKLAPRYTSSDDQGHVDPQGDHVWVPILRTLQQRWDSGLAAGHTPAQMSDPASPTFIGSGLPEPTIKNLTHAAPVHPNDKAKFDEMDKLLHPGGH